MRRGGKVLKFQIVLVCNFGQSYHSIHFNWSLVYAGTLKMQPLNLRQHLSVGDFARLFFMTKVLFTAGEVTSLICQTETRKNTLINFISQTLLN